MICKGCDKNNPDWMFVYNSKKNDLCMMCNNDNIKVEEVEKHTAEVVEDKGCSGGGCTL